MPKKKVPKGKQPLQREHTLKHLEPVEKELKHLNEEQYATSPTLQAVFEIIETIKAGESIRFPRLGDIAVGTIDIKDLNAADQKCIICWKKMKNYEKETEWWKEHCVVVAKCGHPFGGKCWLKWLWLQKQMNATRACPVCATPYSDVQYQVVRTDESIWSTHRENIRMIEKTMRHRYKLSYWKNDQLMAPWTNIHLVGQASEIWRLHHIFAINVFLQGTDELDLEEKMIYVKRATSIIRDLWCTNRKYHGFVKPIDLSFILNQPPMPEHCKFHLLVVIVRFLCCLWSAPTPCKYPTTVLLGLLAYERSILTRTFWGAGAVYLNVLHDLIAQYEAKVESTVNAYYVKLELANFNAAEVHFERIITKTSSPDWYYIDYQQGFPNFKWEFADVNRGSLGGGLRFDQLYYSEIEEDDDDEDSDQEAEIEEKVEKKKSTAEKKRKNPLHDWRITTLLFNIFFGILYFSVLRDQYTLRILDTREMIWKPATLNSANGEVGAMHVT
ncbi:hypothetical protein BDZ45DRAFT_767641 [Acephala macrosclerotiorum]|nr:hypothetical protein BDZ45DRAFT_767641 [Acephala macrosclerotiorum]